MFKTKKVVQTVVLSAMSLGVSVNVLASTINTEANWNGDDSVGWFGEPRNATYGQTFTVGNDNYLNDFSFYLEDTNYDNNNPSSTVSFKAYVMAWDGSKAAGSVLYQSNTLSTTDNQGKGGFEKFTFDTGSLELEANKQYVAFLSVSGLFSGANGVAWLGSLYGNYDGGNFVELSNLNDFNLLSTTNWSQDFPGLDLAMTMNFSNSQTAATPIPAAVWLFGSGLAGLIASKRKKANLAA